MQRVALVKWQLKSGSAAAWDCCAWLPALEGAHGVGKVLARLVLGLGAKAQWAGHFAQLRRE